MNYKLINTQNKHIRGFTLVEIIVVVGLFASIMTIAVGALFTTQAVNTKLLATQSVLDNLDFSIETIAREIRYGYEFHCAQTLNEDTMMLRKSCPYRDAPAASGGFFLFFNEKGETGDSDTRVVYYASTTRYGSSIFKDEYVNGATTTYQITADNVKIKSLIFYVNGANTSEGSSTLDVNSVADYEQPLVTISISGEVEQVKKNFQVDPLDGIKKDTGTVKFNLQTSVSARELDY